MKMGFGIFFGILLILVGVAIIIRILFGIDIPVLKILIALIFLYIGIRLLTGDFSLKNLQSGENAIIFGETTFKGFPDNQEYTILFGSARIDLSGEDNPKELKKLEINTIFGSSELILKKSLPFHVQADAAFASARLPENKDTAFGKIKYQNASKEVLLDIDAHVVFGEFKVILTD
jgi:predicted membrane protein